MLQAHFLKCLFNSNEIISNNTVNQVDDNSNLSLFTPAQNCRNVITVQAQVHMSNSPAPCHSRITKKAPCIYFIA